MPESLGIVIIDNFLLPFRFFFTSHGAVIFSDYFNDTGTHCAPEEELTRLRMTDDALAAPDYDYEVSG